MRANGMNPIPKPPMSRENLAGAYAYGAGVTGAQMYAILTRGASFTTEEDERAAADALGMGLTMIFGGAVLRSGFGLLGRLFSRAPGRVFWSGLQNPRVLQEATEFARNNGMLTLDMTRAGRNLSALTRGMPVEQRLAMWNRLSAAYANGARGTVHVFHSAQGVGLNSTWATIEYPILRANGVKIIYHLVK